MEIQLYHHPDKLEELTKSLEDWQHKFDAYLWGRLMKDVGDISCVEGGVSVNVASLERKISNHIRTNLEHLKWLLEGKTEVLDDQM